MAYRFQLRNKWYCHLGVRWRRLRAGRWQFRFHATFSNSALMLESVEEVDNDCQCQLIPIAYDENRDSPERDMVNPSSEDSYMWPIRDTH